MSPTLLPGDYVFTINTFRPLIKKNNLIVFFDKTHSFIIKRIRSIDNNKLFLKSDNEKTDSIFCQKPLNKTKAHFMVLFIIKSKYVDLILACKNKILFFV